MSRSVLVVDALNCLDYFCPYVTGSRSKRDPWEVVGIMRSRIREFLEAGEASELSCKFVVDCGWSSSEARAKWRSRRAREVKEGCRGVIVGVDTLLVELLRHQGAEVYTAEGRDGDDIVALLAHHAGPQSLILSGDRDMFRYQLPNIGQRLMETFHVQQQASGGKVQQVLSLVPTSKTERPGVSRRDIQQLAEAIPWEPELWLVPVSKLAVLLKEKSQGYIRGTSCSFVKEFGNLHGLLKPLRRAIYTLLEVPGQIREMYPEWDSEKQQVFWVDELVTPSTEDVPEDLLQLLADPDNPEAGIRARRWLAEKDPSCSGLAPGGDPQERQYGRCFLLAELLQALPGATRSMFETLQQISGQQMEEAADGGSRPEPPSLVLVCSERTCMQSFTVHPKEQMWFATKGYSVPKRCKPCRAQRQSAGQMTRQRW